MTEEERPHVHEGMELDVRAGEAPPETTHLCHHGCDCWQRGFARYLRATPERSADELDNAEAHALIVARNRAARDLRKNRADMARARHLVIKRAERSRQAIDGLCRLIEEDRVGALLRRSAEEEQRREEAGAKRVPLWLRRLLWPLIVAVGSFDTWYFMQVFQEINSGNSRVSNLERLLSMAPGAAMAVGLVVAGWGLGSPLWRWRREHARRQERRRGAARFFGGVASSLLRLALPVLLIGVAGVWGVVRAYETVNDVDLPASLVAILIMTLSICAISVKVASYDPYAEGEGETRRRLRTARLTLWWRRNRASSAIRAHTQAWSDLCALRDDLVARVVGRYGEAYEFMTYARGFHGKAGALPPPFTAAVRGETEDPVLAQLTRAQFAGIDQPEPVLAALHEVQRTITRCDPGPLREEMRDLRTA